MGKEIMSKFDKLCEDILNEAKSKILGKFISKDDGKEFSIIKHDNFLPKYNGYYVIPSSGKYKDAEVGPFKTIEDIADEFNPKKNIQITEDIFNEAKDTQTYNSQWFADLKHDLNNLIRQWQSSGFMIDPPRPEKIYYKDYVAYIEFNMKSKAGNFANYLKKIKEPGDVKIKKNTVILDRRKWWDEYEDE
jgi:hypothetical protein